MLTITQFFSLEISVLCLDVLVWSWWADWESLTGSVVGAVIITVASAFLQAIPELRMVIYAHY